jgi:hypothetical protein
MSDLPGFVSKKPRAPANKQPDLPENQVILPACCFLVPLEKFSRLLQIVGDDRRETLYIKLRPTGPAGMLCRCVLLLV